MTDTVYVVDCFLIDRVTLSCMRCNHKPVGKYHVIITFTCVYALYALAA